ncbi:branched-chain amino acid transport system substrate-binding protein [Candidatus Planktophila vernalis]|jgi:branched-chain amino acid transport system substrate-binding protein|uniref:Branched-chain amino acid transport system substrate-binding protein n=1 Tax=Candidatus Planktophila vernalis TaxID=1884907 RepID=A0A249KTE8_9ACTN|nr:branched-chain amino acid ABC transporter substrate-binding protein [Candidatus Planktophila vernalis]ASY20046.1 branched-chain amino acid transport system substrate-binding protein [Candidatus Planktophila vernalis]
MNKKIKGSLAVVTAAAVAFGLTSVPAASAAVKTYTIGYQGPLSGGEASTGIDEQNAVKYAIKLFEAKNKGFKIKLVSIDDQGDPAVAGTVAPGVASNKNVLGVVGPAYSGATIASLPYYKSVNMALISPSATRVSLTDPTSPDFGGPIFHRVVGKDDLQGPALAKYATAGVSAAKVFVFDDQSAYAVPLRGFVEAGLKKVAGATVVGGDSVPNTTTDFSPTIAKIKTSGATVVIYTGYYSQAAVFIKQLRDSGSKAVFAGGDGVFNQEFPKLAGAAAEGSKVTGVGGLAGVDAKMEADFKKKMGVSSGVYSVESFDAANILLSGIKAGKTTRTAMLAYVKAYKGKSISGNTIKFDANGDISYGLFAGFTTKNGVLVNTGIIK